MAKLFLLLAAFLLALPGTASALTVRFVPVAEISDATITLGDVVNFDEETPLSAALGSKHLAPAPKPGQSVTLQSVLLKNKILNNFPGTGAIEWTGSEKVVVNRTGISIEAEDIQLAIDDYLQKRSDSLPAAEYSFVPRELPLPFFIPTGELEVEVIPADPKVIGSRRFSLVYKVDGKIVKNISVRGKLKAMAQVAILTQNVKRGEILHPDMVEMKTKDLSRLRTPCTNLREVLGKRLTRSLRTGSVLDMSSIDFPPLIVKGQLVKILINQNGMHLTATGIASMNGKQDQIIRVMNSGSRKIILCRVAAPGIVEVQI